MIDSYVKWFFDTRGSLRLRHHLSTSDCPLSKDIYDDLLVMISPWCDSIEQHSLLFDHRSWFCRIFHHRPHLRVEHVATATCHAGENKRRNVLLTFDSLHNCLLVLSILREMAETEYRLPHTELSIEIGENGSLAHSNAIPIDQALTAELLSSDQLVFFIEITPSSDSEYIQALRNILWEVLHQIDES